MRYCDSHPSARPPARHPHGGGLSYAVLRAALHPRSTLPPPRRSGLRFPPPVGHGRDLANRPGCADPGEGIDFVSLHLHRFGRGDSPRSSRFRLRMRSSMPEELANSNVSADFSASTGPCIRPSLRSDVDLLFRCLRFRLPPAKHSPSPIRITPRHSHLAQTAARSRHRA